MLEFLLGIVSISILVLWIWVKEQDDIERLEYYNGEA